MKMLGLLVQIFVALLIFAPQLAGLDLIIGELVGLKDGVVTFFSVWLQAVTWVVLQLHGTELMARTIVGLWTFLALGFGFTKMFVR